MKKIVLFIAWLATAVLVGYIMFNPGQFFINGTLVLGWLLFSVQQTVNYSEKAFIYWNKLKYFITNPSCSWNMDVMFKGPFTINTFEQIEDVLKKHPKRIDKIRTISDQRKMYQLENFNVEVSIIDSGLNFELQNLKVSYRDSKQVINNDISHLFERLQNRLQISETNFNLTVDFQGTNPYYGLYINRLNAEHINHFNIRFKLDDDRVIVSDRRIEVSTSDLTKMRSLTQDYLTFSPR